MTQPTRDRRELLQSVQAGRVYRSMGGCDMQMARRGQNRRVERRLRELREAGWVELGEDGRAYELTAAGVKVLADLGSDQMPTHSEAHDHEVPKIIPGRRWVCAGCGGPAHPGHGWRCPICGWSAYRTAPDVDREATDG